MAGSNTSAVKAALSYINPLETLSGFKKELKRQAVDEGIKKLPSDVIREVTGVEHHGTSQRGEMKPGVEVNLKSHEKKAKPRMDMLGGIDYRREVVHGTEMVRRSENSELAQKMAELRQEIARLASSIQTVSREAKVLSVEQAPQNASKYQANFLEWMLSVVRAARMKVEDSGAWMAVSKKKNGYDQLAASQGTKFTLSSERTAATQTG